MIASLGGEQVPLGEDIVLSLEGIKTLPANLPKSFDPPAREPRNFPATNPVISRGHNSLRSGYALFDAGCDHASRWAWSPGGVRQCPRSL